MSEDNSNLTPLVFDAFQVADRLNISYATVRRWVDRGLLAPPLAKSNKRLWRRVDVDDCVEELARQARREAQR